MKPWNSIKRFVRRSMTATAIAAAIVLNRYDGAQRNSKDRSYIDGYVQDARFDVDQVTRYELVRKSRSFERNNAILNRLADLFEQFTVGAQGLQISPATDDEDWNEKAQTWWDDWCSLCDLTSRSHFSTLQSLIARSWFVDGEIFILKTRGEEVRVDGRLIQPARPRIQLIEAHRVETPAALATQEGARIIDGIEVDRRGRPIAYHVRDVDLSASGDQTSYRRIPADQVIHIFEASRPGQYRGLPFTYPVINDLHDLDDLQILEMRAAKQHARIANILKKKGGEHTDEDLVRSGVQVTTEDGQGNETEEQRLKFVQKVLGGETLALDADEELEQVKSERPSVATREYWDYLTAKVCAGVGISKLLVFPVSLQGTVARAELDLANAFFRSRSAVLATAFKEIYVWVMDWARQNVRELADAPYDWRECYTCPPRSVNVDNGRNSSAIIAELEAGTRTYEDVYAERGLNWRRQLKQKAKEAAYIRKLAIQFEVTPDEIAKRANLNITELIAAEEAQKKADEAEDAQIAKAA